MVENDDKPSREMILIRNELVVVCMKMLHIDGYLFTQDR